MNDGNWRAVVKIVHASADLDGPVDENVWRYPPVAGQDSVERPAYGVLHHKTKLWRDKADTAQHDDVGVVQGPEQLGFLHDILAGDVVVELWVVTGFFDSDELASVEGSFDFTEAT